MRVPAGRRWRRSCSSGDRVAITAYLGRSDAFDRAVAEFAVAYSNQTDRDHASFAEAAGSGELTAASV